MTLTNTINKFKLWCKKMSIKKALEPKVETFEKEDGIMSLVTAMLPKDEFWTLLKKAGFPRLVKLSRGQFETMVKTSLSNRQLCLLNLFPKSSTNLTSKLIVEDN